LITFDLQFKEQLVSSFITTTMSSDDMITEHTGPNQVVHTRQDSTKELDMLFHSSLQNSDGSQSSWLNKKLPESFYKPMVRSHSRESGIDGPQLPEQQSQPGPTFTRYPNHKRQTSAPELMVGSNRRGTPNPTHQRTQSQGLEVILDERANIEHIPLPAGWEVAYTPDGKRYFIE